MTIKEVMELGTGWQLDFEIMRLLGYEKRRFRHYWGFYKDDKLCFKSRYDQDKHYRYSKGMGVGDPPSIMEWSLSSDNARRLPIPENMYWELHIVGTICSAFLCDKTSETIFFSNVNEDGNLALAIVRTWLLYVYIFIQQGRDE